MSSTLDHASYYFAYGSNMNAERVVTRKMQFVEIKAGQLEGYKLVFNKRSVKTPGAAAANVEPEPGAVTEGVLYRLPEANEILKMDPFEGYPVRYRREVRALRTQSGYENAWVYMANPEFIGDHLKPAKWYLQHLLAGKEMLSADYFQSLCEVQCLADSDVEP